MESPTPTSRARVERVPPHSEDAERGVLGSVLLDAARVMDLCVERQLVPACFYQPAHRAIYETLCDMWRESRAIDVLTVSERMRRAGRLDSVGGDSRLHLLLDATPTPAHAEYYIEIVRQRYLLRCIIEKAREAEARCYSSEEDANALLGRTYRQGHWAVPKGV